MIEPPASYLSHVAGEICRIMPTRTAGEDTSLRLSSAAFGDGDRIPTRHTCEGEDVSPPLTWSGAPEGTRSFAIMCEDPDAPIGVWRHWAVYDIPFEVGELEEGCPGKAHFGAIRQAMNDFKHTGYGGPCPPPGDGMHRYRFTLFALDVDRLDLEEGARVRDVKKAVSCHALAEAVLIGTYSR